MSKQCKTYKNIISIIIPTMDRPREISGLLKSIQTQTYKPDQLIIVDAGREAVEKVTYEFPLLNIDYLRSNRPGLTRQKNDGISALKPEITLVAYLDDDIILEPDALEQMLSFWDNALDNTGGASFNIVNNITGQLNIYTKCFMLSGAKGKLLRSGFNVIYSPVVENVYVDWLCGGATVWRRNIVEEYKFDEWLVGYGHNDDIDYSVRVGKRYGFAIIAKAKLYHFPKPLEIQDNYLFGKSAIFNRYYVVGKHACFSKPCFYWATFGQILAGLFRGIIRKEKSKLIRMLGYISALVSIWLGKLERIDIT